MRQIVRHARFTRELGELLRREPLPKQAEEALAGFEWAVARDPGGFGNAVYGKPGFFCRPFHSESCAYLVLYTFNEMTVTLVSVRSVPSGQF